MKDAAARIDEMMVQSAQAVDLARLVSFAVLVEPALLRETRLSLLPRVDAGAEADLWFGPLVQTRSRDGIVLFPAVAEMLRNELRAEQAEETWRITERLHDYLPPAIKLEEKLNWLSMNLQDNAREISELFQPVLTALIGQNQSDVANWAGRALPRMSPAVRASEGAAMLAAATDLRLGRSWTLAEHLRGGHIPDWFVSILPDDLANVELGITVTSSEIVFDPTPATNSQRIRLPATDPRVMQISSKGVSQIVFVDAKASRSVPISIDDGPVVLTAINGKAFTLERESAPIEPESPRPERIRFGDVTFFSMEVLRARRGDCLILHYGTADDPHLILIDGGPSGVYKPNLRPRLAQLHAAHGLAEYEPLPVDVVMVCGVNDAHIHGILELSKEQLGGASDLRISVENLWHNSLDDLLATPPGQLVADFGVPDPGGEDKYEQTVEVFASIPEGRTLRDNAKRLGWVLNHEFNGRLIVATNASEPFMLGALKVAVVGPMESELIAFQARDKWLREQGKSMPRAALAAFADASLHLSSIVVLAEVANKSMLLTGEARCDKILEGLELVHVLAPGGTRHINILKVPRQGSDNHMEAIFFKRLLADHYIFSGDGEDGNPERTMLQMLLDARGSDDDYSIHFTYPIDEIDEARQMDWKKKQARKMIHSANTPVRKDWSHAEHSLATFFQRNPKLAKKVKIVDERRPHIIDLLDRVMPGGSS
jgi:hypothetical protein